MHQTASTALVRVEAAVWRSWKDDVWIAQLNARCGDGTVATSTTTFDAGYWSAQAVEAVVQVLQATLEASYEL